MSIILDTAIFDIPAMLITGERKYTIETRFDFPELPGALEETTPLAEAEGTLTFHQTGFLIQGIFAAEAEQCCHRCGEAFGRHIQENFKEDLIFVEYANQKMTGEVELQHEDFYETHSQQEPFDFESLIKELLIISLSYDAYCPKCRIQDNQE